MQFDLKNYIANNAEPWTLNNYIIHTVNNTLWIMFELLHKKLGAFIYFFQPPDFPRSWLGVCLKGALEKYHFRLLVSVAFFTDTLTQNIYTNIFKHHLLWLKLFHNLPNIQLVFSFFCPSIFLTYDNKILYV